MKFTTNPNAFFKNEISISLAAVAIASLGLWALMLACNSLDKDVLVDLIQGPDGSSIIVSERHSALFQGDSGDVLLSFLESEHLRGRQIPAPATDISKLLKFAVPLVLQSSGDIEYQVAWPKPHRVEVKILANPATVHLYSQAILLGIKSGKTDEIKVLMVY